MVGMAVVDANQVHAFRPCVVIHVQHLDRIDDVTAGSIFRRDVLPTAGFDHAFRFTDVAKQEAATFLGERSIACSWITPTASSRSRIMVPANNSSPSSPLRHPET